MKLANVIPIYKKDNRSEKGSYQTASILPNISKVFERCFYKQIFQYFEEIISNVYIQGSQWSMETWKTWKRVCIWKKSGKTWKTKGKLRKNPPKSGKSQGKNL